MMTFFDYYQNKVSYSFEYNPFSNDPRHVWVICRYKNEWLLTKHGDRGLEFPGGKVEPGETPEEAAIREVNEETGATIASLTYIGQYRVEGKGAVIVKNVYFATIDHLEEKQTYYETKGPVLLENLPDNIEENERFSFMMKDQVLKESLQYIKERHL